MISDTITGIKNQPLNPALAVIVSEIVCNIFYKDGERKVIENNKGETVGMIGLFNRFLQFSDSI